MTRDGQDDLTQLLARARTGKDSDLNQLLPLVYDELRQIAGAFLRSERKNHTLQPTGLVHEAYLKLVDQSVLPFETDVHFRAIAARAMRQVLVDHARKKMSKKRGGDHVRLTLFEQVAAPDANEIDVLALEDALVGLAQFDERKSRIVELMFFGGMTMKQSAEVLGISHKTVEADWYMARAWLSKRLSEATAHES